MPLAVFTTLPDADTAAALARSAVEARLAACVQIDSVTSVFAWDGVQTETEHRLLFKVSDAGYDALAAHILDAHPYEEPALWAYRMEHGAPGFLDWIDRTTGA